MIYFDNAATTAVSESAASAALAAMRENYGNPSSLHSMGIKAGEILSLARETIARSLSCKSGEVIFTSGATESNNLAILGSAAKFKKGGHVITSAVEHPSVLEAMAELTRRGFEVTYLKPDISGMITPQDVVSALRSDTVLVSLMLVNNETGAVSPINEITRAVTRQGSRPIIHCDGVQGFLKLPSSMSELGVDLFSISGHKIHAPKGVGALYIRAGTRISPIVFGGGQERGIRSGTENLPQICGLAVAATESCEHEKVLALSEYLSEKLRGLPGYVRIGGGSPFIHAFALRGCKTEVMINSLSGKGICISGGSACSKGKRSHVLRGMGLPNDVIDGALRVSISKYNTMAEIDTLFESLLEALKLF